MTKELVVPSAFSIAALRLVECLGDPTGTGCMDKTVTRQSVRPFSGHMQWRGGTSPRRVPGRPTDQGKTWLAVDQCSGQAIQAPSGTSYPRLIHRCGSGRPGTAG